MLEESLPATPIERIHGIVNGTTNFILSEMAPGQPYDEALAEAQREGFAEADPSDDVSGRDAAAKMAILARLAFGTPVRLDDVRYEGIEHLHGDDLQYARELGLGLKLIGTAERLDGGPLGARPSGLPVRRTPARLGGGPVQRSHRRVRGDHRDHDVRARAPAAPDRQRRARRRGQRDARRRRARRRRRWPLALIEDVQSAFYLHMEVADRPGVLAAITQRARRARRLDQVGRAARTGRAARAS